MESVQDSEDPIIRKNAILEQSKLAQPIDHLLAEFTAYSNSARSSMARDHLPPMQAEQNEADTLSLAQIRIKTSVGGLVKGSERKARSVVTDELVSRPGLSTERQDTGLTVLHHIPGCLPVAGEHFIWPPHSIDALWSCALWLSRFLVCKGLAGRQVASISVPVDRNS